MSISKKLAKELKILHSDEYFSHQLSQTVVFNPEITNWTFVVKKNC